MTRLQQCEVEVEEAVQEAFVELKQQARYSRPFLFTHAVRTAKQAGCLPAQHADCYSLLSTCYSPAAHGFQLSVSKSRLADDENVLACTAVPSVVQCERCLQSCHACLVELFLPVAAAKLSLLRAVQLGECHHDVCGMYSSTQQHSQLFDHAASSDKLGVWC